MTAQDVASGSTSYTRPSSTANAMDDSMYDPALMGLEGAVDGENAVDDHNAGAEGDSSINGQSISDIPSLHHQPQSQVAQASTGKIAQNSPTVFNVSLMFISLLEILANTI